MHSVGDAKSQIQLLLYTQ